MFYKSKDNKKEEKVIFDVERDNNGKGIPIDKVIDYINRMYVDKSKKF